MKICSFFFLQNRRGMTKQLRDLEAELDEERKQKTAAMTIKKVSKIFLKNSFHEFFLLSLNFSIFFYPSKRNWKETSKISRLPWT